VRTAQSGTGTEGVPAIDLASRALGGSVVWASDELFAPRENLIDPAPPSFDPATFSGKGKVYDGWESRRRRTAGNDAAIIRLGAAGVVRRVVVDTAFFAGNFPPEVSVEGLAVEGFPAVEELLAGDWRPLVPRSAVAGDAIAEFDVTDPHRYTHVRLSIFPDGGVARLRVLGRALPDPALLTGTVDLAAAENGGAVVDCSNAFYGSPSRMLLPDRARTMGEGWENARRRGGGNDYVTVALAAAGVPRRIEVDTSYFVGNAPGEARICGVDARTADVADPAAWFDVVPRRALLPDTRHLLPVPGAAAVTHLRIDVYPDGGVARLRVHGELDAAGRDAALLGWWNALPASALVAACAARWGIGPDDATALAEARPVADVGQLPDVVRDSTA
jgi:allantoicase